MNLPLVGLGDKYDLSKDRVFLSGVQALVRLCLLQAERDRRAGLDTGGYVSGYRGSPLGGLDRQFGSAVRELNASGIVVEPGLNEDLAATAIWGTQQAELRGEGRHDGVFAMWYGKGPGVDRAGDVFRHANLAGSSRHGGVLVLLGDDHTCESSTTAHQSEFAMVDAMIPVLNPGDISDMLDYGLHGWALSRYAGTWCALKCVKDNVESTAAVDAGPHRFSSLLPEHDARPEDGLNIRLHDSPLAQEARLHAHKLDAVRAYVRKNGLDRVVITGGDRPSLGIVSTGKSYMDTLQALEELGLDRDRADRLGISLYKIAMPWPLEPGGLRDFACGLDLLMVVEEKRGLIEEQARAILYGEPGAPRIIGKRDEAGATLFPSEAALNPLRIAAEIASRAAELSGDPEMRSRGAGMRERLLPHGNSPTFERRPYFCAGCPHNSSTRIPDGARAYAGIGCHWMVQFMDRNTLGYTHMGGEGANWIGESRFSRRRHVFQNMGDGTYNHSGLMAIRAAVAAGARMTFKILYNDAVAMTGGQSHEGKLDPAMIARDMAALGVKAVEIVTDDPSRHRSAGLPARVRHRDELIRVQEELADTEGVTVLIYDQTCAAENRRRRKRGTAPEAPARVFINEAVCEGCGDCGIQSNCVAILPAETEFGRKRRIDQHACNKDLSCTKGFCPSFVTVEGAVLRGGAEGSGNAAPVLPDPPEPELADLERPFAIAVAGVGGTGVVTLAALIGMAAHLEGHGCGIIDMAGLAQKGGGVLSHVKIARRPSEISAIRIVDGGADLVLGCDLVVASGQSVMPLIRGGSTRAVVNSHEMMTGDFTRNPDLQLPADLMTERIRKAAGQGNASFVNATLVTENLLGDTIAANLFLLGVAFQKGLVPVGADAIREAIRLNGAAPERNIRAFTLGRQLVSAPSEVMARRSGSRGCRPEIQTQRDRRRARRLHRSPRRHAGGLPGCRIRGAIQVDRRIRMRRRTPVFRPPGRTPQAAFLGRRLSCPQADGLQGRIRGGAALHRRLLPGCAGDPVLRLRPPQAASRAAAPCTARPGQRTAAETRLRPLDLSPASPRPPFPGSARHAVRSLRANRRTSSRTSAGGRVRSPRAAHVGIRRQAGIRESGRTRRTARHDQGVRSRQAREHRQGACAAGGAPA